MIKECLFFHLNRKYLKVRCPTTLCYVAQTLLMEITQVMIILTAVKYFNHVFGNNIMHFIRTRTHTFAN